VRPRRFQRPRNLAWRIQATSRFLVLVREEVNVGEEALVEAGTLQEEATSSRVEHEAGLEDRQQVEVVGE
jgi:hypothetical protein